MAGTTAMHPVHHALHGALPRHLMHAVHASGPEHLLRLVFMQAVHAARV